MTEKSKKQTKVALREVKPKGGKFPLSVPRIKSPHDAFNYSQEPSLEIVPAADSYLESEQSQPSTVSTPSQPSTVSQPSTPSQLSTPSTDSATERKVLPVAPERDFQRVANSVVREVSQGLFSGKSKQMYDYLYSLTRGAIVPKRTVRISKPKLMLGTGIGSPQTFYRNINHLESVGLIKRTEISGEWGGNEYEVFLPEEISSNPVHPVHPVQSVNSAQKQVVLVLPETELTVPTLESIDTGVTESPKTFFKTLKSVDDEAPLIRALQALDEAALQATGSGITKKDLEAFESIVHLLIDATAIAQLKTESVTVYLKFAEANLRRRLAFAPLRAARKETPFDPGKNSGVPETSAANESETFEPESMSDEARENALVIYRPVYREQGREALENVRAHMTEEDFDWLIEKLKKN